MHPISSPIPAALCVCGHKIRFHGSRRLCLVAGCDCQLVEVAGIGTVANSTRISGVTLEPQTPLERESSPPAPPPETKYPIPARFSFRVETYLAGEVTELCAVHRVTLPALRAALRGILEDLTPPPEDA